MSKNKIIGFDSFEKLVIVNESEVQINEWDPSMSNDPSAPWNQPDPFTERNEKTLIELEKMLKEKGHEIPEDLWEKISDDNKILNEFDEEVENKFGELYTKHYEGKYDKKQGEPQATKEHNDVLDALYKSKEYINAKGYLKQSMVENALTLNLAKKHAEEFWPIYKKVIEKLYPKTNKK